ncbi:acylneuraminate cytidylyltransferase family protein [Psychrosphaera sp. B3R10]|uniref:acylneuraminate cytidylyltransferase family protein n=1 Tax=unclassified Psychrosphaera TaxID=2641570 RepID=UPI001C0A5DE2|nr:MULTISPECIES: acylneuraminate cytidylyltransferase family protein [unclassified Psychrosphaera]MBU2881832.1 acylneuraminate cytidylyltransferase family protein [Psychrosphaera sp. I2R16]MBU2989196.1 acylneuraminate cytidylyltransferase family protein [Psychrosphaera sp. B3R10]MDO6719988.1 acylneuraminate cytidylyltransferase family protein [Psychrosphaera sp. 1_MG-2023]
MNLAIIPARKGSKRLPNKNLLDLAGKPLIKHTIDAALKSSVDDVVVSTDCEVIRNIAIKAGAKVLELRPDYLSNDVASTIDVLRFEMEKYESLVGPVDEITLLQPTSPLRNNIHIDEAINLFRSNDAEIVVSVCPNEHPADWNLSLGKGNLIDTTNLRNARRSQDYPTSYRLNGAIYCIGSSYLKETESILSSSKSYAYVMSPGTSVDIDTLFDFKVASLLLSDINKC